MRPRLLDLFCGAGGAAEGYYRAGFQVLGVDHVVQPNYPFRFRQGDAFFYLVHWLEQGIADEFDAIHASPPCQRWTPYRRRDGHVPAYPDLIAPLRPLLESSGLPYVIENVVDAPLADPVLLCGSMFDLDVQRHRNFETNWPLEAPWMPCRHRIWGPDRFPGGRSTQRTGSSRGLVRGTVEIGTWDIPVERQRDAMGVDWMTLEELSEAIPPDYTQFVGSQLRRHLEAAAA